MNNQTIRPFALTLLTLCSSFLPSLPGSAANKEPLNPFDMRFIKRAISHDKTETTLAALAAQKAVRPEVKSYAGTLVADHTRSEKELSALAAVKGVSPPEAINPKQAAAIQQLQQLEQSTAADFDTDFLAEILKAHKASVSNFEEAAVRARDEEVQAFAKKMLPTLKAHLQKAEDLSPKETADAAKEPDNTARNMRDRDGTTPTPLDQGSSKYDTEITAAIRKQIMELENVSVYAQNVKIITQNGKVTLRGPVRSAEEKRIIDEIASGVVRRDQVDSQLEVN